MNIPSNPEPDLPSEPGSDAGGSARGRWLFGVLAAATLLAFVAFRLDAFLRAQGPLIGDSSEYLLLANSLLTGAEVPVAPVRNCFFALLLSGLFAPLNILLDQPFDADAARVLPLLFHMVALLGTWTLARELLGSRVGAIVAAFLLAVLPDYGYWGTGVLTDVPASACVVWAVIAWVRGRPLTSGFVFGIGVLLRYQTILVLLPFVLLAALTRRRRQLVRFSVSLLVIPLGLALLDGLYWGTPWLSIREHFGVFSDHLGSSLGPREAESVPETGGGTNSILHWIEAAYLKARHSRFLWDAPRVLGWTLIATFCSYPLARPWLDRKKAGDLTFAVCVCTYFGLCFLADDDTRYLVVITPLLAAVGGCCAAFWIEQLASRASCGSPAIASTIRWTALITFVGTFSWTCWGHQQRLHYRPHGALIDATVSVVPRSEAVHIGLHRPWVLAHQFPVTGMAWCSWDAAGPIRIVDLGCLGPQVNAHQPGEEADQLTKQALDELDFVLLTEPGPQRSLAPAMWEYLNRRAVFDGVFHDPDENLIPAWRFRLLPLKEETSLFWSSGEPLTSAEEPLAIFAGGLTLMRIEGVCYPDTPGALRLDLCWRFDEAPAEQSFCRVMVRNQDSSEETTDQHEFVPPAWIDGEGGFVPGATARVSRFLLLPGEAPGGTVQLFMELHAPKAGPRDSAPTTKAMVWNRDSVRGPSVYKTRVLLGEAAPIEGR